MLLPENAPTPKKINKQKTRARMHVHTHTRWSRPLHNILLFSLAGRCSEGALQTLTGMCVRGLSVCSGRQRVESYQGTNVEHYFSSLLRNWDFCLSFYVAVETRWSALKVKTRFFVRLRMDSEARVDGQRRRWAAALSNFCRGKLEHRSAHLRRSKRSVRLVDQVHSFRINCRGKLVLRGSRLVDHAWSNQRCRSLSKTFINIKPSMFIIDILWQYVYLFSFLNNNDYFLLFICSVIFSWITQIWWIFAILNLCFAWFPIRFDGWCTVNNV